LANTALIVFEHVEEFSWVGKRASVARIAWPVDDSVPDNQDGSLSLSVLFYRDGETSVTDHGAAFYAGNVPGLPDTPPDFMTDSGEVIAAGMASMDSPFEPRQGTFIEPLA